MNGVASITLNKVVDVPPGVFAGFRLITSLDEGLPYGYFQLLDRDASLFAKFENLQIGAMVDIEIQSMDDESVKVKYPTFYILQIEDDCSLDSSAFAGMIRVWFGHPWFLFKDIKNHAYKPTNNGELIKKILKNEDRGMAFDVEDKNFSKTDDTGEIARYKICETDWDFIQNKIMPYTSIGQQPAHFFANEQSKFFMKSFKDIYSDNSTAIFIQKEEKLAEDDNLKAVEEIMNSNGMKKGDSFPVQEASVKISDRITSPEVFPTFYLENSVDGSFITGGKMLNNKVEGGKLLPFDQYYMLNVKGTSVKVVHNRQILDALTLLFQTAQDVDKMFQVTTTTLFCGHKLSIGQTAELYMAKLKIDGATKTNWLNGKWLVSRIEHFTDEDDYRTFLTKTYLLRPSFVGPASSSSLAMPELLYEAS
jgi:hypothetical protein